MLKEAKRLYDLGFGIHWLRPNSKAPVKSGWSGPKRDSWQQVEADYRPEYGLGVRLGESSKVDGHYLANIDVDIKSSETVHQEEALAAVKLRFPALKDAPLVKTGYGYRYFVVTKEPLQSGKLAASPELTRVFMPSAAVNQQQLKAVAEGRLTQAELKAGWRVRGAWEIEFMSSGKQVVLPPTIHPDTKRPYAWIRPVTRQTLPLVSPEGLALGKGRGQTAGARQAAKFEPIAVDLVSSPIPNRTVEMILTGKGVENRSNSLFSVAKVLCKAKFTDQEILSVLTDQTTFLGETAYDTTHANTKNRAVAAEWVRRFTLVKARAETDAAKAFEDEAIITVELSGEDAKAQAAELAPWAPKRSGKYGEGAPNKTLENTIGALIASYGVGLFREDQFTGYQVYGKEVPWGGKVGEEFSDRDRPLLTEWFAKTWGFEPPANMIYDAVVALAAKDPFHPIKDYLEAIVWDKEPRVSTWLRTYLGANDVPEKYLNEVSTSFLVAMIARIYEPGCKFDYMLILKGPQGARKSTVFQILAGGEKYCTSAIISGGGKEAILKMRSKWIIEFAELSTLKADVRALKNFMSTQVDRDRLPYGHLAKDFPRTCVFGGSTNDDDFLIDETGDRRYWPYHVTCIDIEGLKRDRDQLLAEAKFLYDTGTRFYLTNEAEEEARGEQLKWKPTDIMVDKVEKTIERNTHRDTLIKFPEIGFTLAELMACMDCKDDMQTQHRVGKALKTLGYKNKPSRKRGRQLRLWFLDGTPMVP